MYTDFKKYPYMTSKFSENPNSALNMTFQDYKSLTPEEREFFVFEKLSKIDPIYTKLDNMDKMYSGKWVERAAKWFATTTIGAVIVSVITYISTHK